jgi:tRNA A37 threonylcarbamoyladenosine synthetase subunit TsaC/SUA5/YrdC
MPDGTILYDPSLIHDIFHRRIDVVIDGGPVTGNPSSVISLINDFPEVIRKGLGDVSVFE